MDLTLFCQEPWREARRNFTAGVVSSNGVGSSRLLVTDVAMRSMGEKVAWVEIAAMLIVFFVGSTSTGRCGGQSRSGPANHLGPENQKDQLSRSDPSESMPKLEVANSKTW